MKKFKSKYGNEVEEVYDKDARIIYKTTYIKPTGWYLVGKQLSELLFRVNYFFSRPYDFGSVKYHKMVDDIANRVAGEISRRNNKL